jgi:hypothetical protein
VAQSVAPKEAVVDLTYLYANYRLPMVRMAVLLVDDLATAEDVVQDAFAAMHQRSRSLRDPHAAVGYLRGERRQRVPIGASQAKGTPGTPGHGGPGLESGCRSRRTRR